MRLGNTLDDALEGLTPEEAMTRSHGGSAIAWTVGHLANMLDSWINARFQAFPRHPVVSNAQFRVGGTGEWADWEEVLAATHEVRGRARPYLDSALDVNATIPYDGSIELLQETGLRLSYALLRIAAHHLLHTGEIVALRSRLGHNTDELSGPDWGRHLA